MKQNFKKKYWENTFLVFVIQLLRSLDKNVNACSAMSLKPFITYINVKERNPKYTNKNIFFQKRGKDAECSEMEKYVFL